MNAAGVLSELVAHGVGRLGPVRDGPDGAVVLRGFEVAVAVVSSERGLRARWRERVGNRPVSYLLVADDPSRSGWVRVLGPGSVDAPVRSVAARALVDAIGETVGMGPLEKAELQAARRRISELENRTSRN